MLGTKWTAPESGNIGIRLVVEARKFFNDQELERIETEYDLADNFSIFVHPTSLELTEEPITDYDLKRIGEALRQIGIKNSL